jgi:lipid-A-disaccharide synthase
MNKGKIIFISAGEQSGELHGSALMRELRNLADISFFGLGGDMMISEGLNALAQIKDLAATGIAEVAKKYTYFRSVLKKSVTKVNEIQPDAVVLIDYPGFNMRFAEELRKTYRGKIIYYISPQLWAWHEKRVHSIKKNIDKMLVVFPFEVDFYKKFGVDAEYVGHPLVKKIGEFLRNTQKNISHDSVKKITILPGSRNDEVKHHLPVLLDVIDMLRKDFKIEIYISRAQAIRDDIFDNLMQNVNDFKIIKTDLYTHILKSDLAMTKAGTSTMECSLIGTPFLIFYKTYPVNYYLLKPLVKIKNIGIVNILAGENIIREFIQKDFTNELIYTEAKRILTDKNYTQEIRSKLKYLWELLGSGDASLNAANRIYQTALL